MFIIIVFGILLQIYHMSCPGVQRGKVIWITNIHCPIMTRENDTEDQMQKKEEKFTNCRNHIDFDKTDMTLLLKGIGFDSKAKDQIKNKTTEVKFLKIFWGPSWP